MSDVLTSPQPDATPPSAPHIRRRRAVVAGVLGLLVVVVVLLAGGSGSGAAADRVTQLVPADALGFVDVSLGSHGAGAENGLSLAERLPDFGRVTGSVGSRIGAILGGGHAVSLTGDILPWVGDQAALALLNTPTATAGSLLVIDVSNAPRAHAFVTREGAVRRGSYRGTPLYAYPSGSELAFVSHFLLVGQDVSVRAALDAGLGGAPSLASSAVYQRAVGPEPAGRVVSAYASLAGVRRLLSPRGGIVGAVGDLLYQPALQGVALGVVPTHGGAQVLIHSALDPTLQKLNHGAQTFTPTLQKVLPSGAILMLDVHGLDRMAPAVLSAGSTAGIGGGVGQLLRRLGVALTAEGVDVHAITSLFSGETAVGIVPHGGSQTLVVVARVPHVAAARTQLAQLEVPLAQLFSSPNATKVPTFNDLTAGGVAVRQLALANGLELDYAVFGKMVVISTSSAGVADVAKHARSLARDPGYRAVLPADPSGVSSLIYMSLPDLVALGRSTDLLSGSGFQRLAPDLAAISEAGVTSTRSSGGSTVRLNLRLPAH